MTSDLLPTRRAGMTHTTMVNGRVIDKSVPEDYDPRLYAFDSIADTLHGFKSLTTQHIEQYHHEGFLAIDDAFSSKMVHDAYQALRDTIILKAGSPSPSTQYEAWAARRLDNLTPQQLAAAIRKLTDLDLSDQRLRALAFDRQMLSLVSRLMNGAVPTILQAMALLKQPNGREKPCHQDRAYFNVALDTPVVGTWIALDSATPENGCMRVWPGRHRKGPLVHFQRRDWQICDKQILGQRCVAVPLKPGGLLVFDALLPHGTPHNPTNQRRWALQYHYSPQQAAKTDDQARIEVFGSEGKDVEC